MTTARAAIFCPRPPIGLGREEAASFLGISAGTFDRLVREGQMPFARLLGGRRIWDADEIATAFRRIPRSPPAGMPPGLAAIDDGDAEDPWDRVRA